LLENFNTFAARRLADAPQKKEQMSKVCCEGVPLQQPPKRRRKKTTNEHISIMLNVISLGAGVQSSAMALMACHGIIKPMPDCAIFADTGDESLETYRWIRELTKLLTFRVIWLQPPRGQKLSDGIVNNWGFSNIPAWVMGPNGRPSIGRRQCTNYWKIIPVRHELRHLFPKQRVNLWMGISTDEISRMKESRLKWLTHCFPLVDSGFNRDYCAKFLEKQTSFKVPKSACVFCPFKAADRWIATQQNEVEMEKIEKVERILNPRGEFLTKHLKPIREIDFTNGQKTNDWINECEGMCGV
jgi:hypothetical protein